MVADINPGGNDSSPYEFTPFQATLFFGASSPSGSELWRLRAPIPPAPDTTQPVVTTSAEDEAEEVAGRRRQLRRGLQRRRRGQCGGEGREARE